MDRMNRQVWLSVVFAVNLFGAASARGADDSGFKDYCNGATDNIEPAQHGWYWTLENDVAGAIKSDKYYTQGAQIGYTFRYDKDDAGLMARAASPLCRLFGFDANGANGSKVLGAGTLLIGQQLFTPRDTSALAPIPDDRPYAGWLYLGLRQELLQPLAASSGNGSEGHRRWRTHALELQLGVVGPSALGEQTQRAAHDLDGSDHSNGWDNQISDRFGAQAFYNFSTRLDSFEIGNGSSGVVADWLFHAGGAAGNLQQHVEAGTVVRLGRNMGPMQQRTIVPSALTASLKSTDPTVLAMQAAKPNLDTKECGFLFGAKECYVFAGVAARGVRKNIFLESTTNGAGALVSPDRLVYELTWGFRARYSWARFDYISTTRSREFQPAPANPLDGDGRHAFGSFTMSCYGEFGRYDGKWRFACPGIVAAAIGFLAFR